jgi:hypothetical protein
LNDTDREKPKNSENYSNATLSTTNSTWTDPGAMPGLRGERPATNRLSHVMAIGRHFVALDGLMVILLATGPKVCGFKYGRGR